MNKERFMKNGVFSLEYDKETLQDMVLELQEENQKQREIIDKAIAYIEKETKLMPTNGCKIRLIELLVILQGCENK